MCIKKPTARLDILIMLVIATFIIAGGYVGYHYSQDPSNFEAHSIGAELYGMKQALAIDAIGNTITNTIHTTIS